MWRRSNKLVRGVGAHPVIWRSPALVQQTCIPTHVHRRELLYECQRD